MSDKNTFLTKIAYQIAERIRSIAITRNLVPVYPFPGGGGLRKSVDKYDTHTLGVGEATVGSNLAYARAVHDGRPAIVIRPKNKKFLAWPIKGTMYTASGRKRGKGNKQVKWAFAWRPVKQLARPARPFFQWAADDMHSRGYDFLDPLLSEYVTDEIATQIKGSFTMDIKI